MLMFTVVQNLFLKHPVQYKCLGEKKRPNNQTIIRPFSGDAGTRTLVRTWQSTSLLHVYSVLFIRE